MNEPRRLPRTEGKAARVVVRRDLRKTSLFSPAPLNRSFRFLLLCHHITNGAGAIRTHDRRVWSPLPFQTRPRPHATYYIFNYFYFFNISTRLYRFPREIIKMLIKLVSCILHLESLAFVTANLPHPVLAFSWTTHNQQITIPYLYTARRVIKPFALFSTYRQYKHPRSCLYFQFL